MIVAGRVSQKMALVLRQIYDRMPAPRWVISMGLRLQRRHVQQLRDRAGVDHVIPADVYLERRSSSGGKFLCVTG